ncbi:glucan biosynthesis protein [Acuticoccus yangtzensis]|uniref:glucan biosynthesis protein n=1 Tax=Acuticoccus yangtzensis TaxID=1443441 RepID=UPI0009498315|nr:glucan biosynthesis protein [Acuticoccus yangtzensis]ORE93369.1 glucan biosynthesis protein D [Stappia sp. 22II-S9-Z10]
MPTRRTIVSGSLALLGASAFPLRVSADSTDALDLGAAETFRFDTLVDRAREMSGRPYEPPHIIAGDVLEAIDYDAHWQIRYRDGATFSPPGTTAEVQLFHQGRYFREPVHMFVVDGVEAREILYRKSYFEMPDDSPAQQLPNTIGFAGFRVMRPGLKPDWVSFLGASYFRTDGPEGQYGLSARGLAIDTGLSQPEEFPRFSHFYLAAPEDEGDDLTVYALLDSRSVTGAYKFGLRRDAVGGGHATTVSCRLFFRRAVERLGIAPLTSMYWYSERDERFGTDWRPEIHDSDGLALATGAGERLWRPLNNPLFPTTSSFSDTDPRGFGLSQRDRDFLHYQDDGVFYNRRASVWVEPLGEWGQGAVQLVELPTDDETMDNIVAYWAPAQKGGEGVEMDFAYRLHWVERDPVPNVATVIATRQGHSGVPGQGRLGNGDKLVIDFEGEILNGLARDSGVKAVVSIARGKLLSEPAAWPIVDTDFWRLAFDFELDGDEPAEVRAYMEKDGEALSETFIGQLLPGRMIKTAQH